MSQTLKFGNKTWATKVGSTLAYNDENGNYKPLPFAFTRSTSATRVNKEGLIEVVTNDRPRIDYTDTSDGVLLLEKAATNLLTYSQDFSNSSWTKNNSTVTSGFTSPDGTTNAFKLIEDTTVGEHSISASPLVGVSDLTTSIFVKYAGSEYIVLRSNSSGGAYLNCTFNLLTGENTFNGFLFGFEITLMANGWFRISGTNRSSASAFRVNSFILSPTDVTSNSTPSHTGDGTSGVYIYGAQVEAGNLSSYIPSQGSATTRVAETATGAGNSEVFNSEQGVLFANIAANADDSSNKMYSLSDGTNGNRFYISLNSNNIDVNLRLGGSTQFGFNHSVNNIKSFHKISFKYKQSDFSLFVDGFKVAISSTGNIFPNGTLNSLSFDRADGVDDFYGKTKEIGYYNTILTDLELETLTSYKSWTSMVNELNLNIIYNG